MNYCHWQRWNSFSLRFHQWKKYSELMSENVLAFGVEQHCFSKWFISLFICQKGQDKSAIQLFKNIFSTELSMVSFKNFSWIPTSDSFWMSSFSRWYKVFVVRFLKCRVTCFHLSDCGLWIEMNWNIFQLSKKFVWSKRFDWQKKVSEVNINKSWKGSKIYDVLCDKLDYSLKNIS